MSTRPPIALVLAGLLVLPALTSPPTARADFAELAISARPDSLVDHVTVAYGEPFQAYVVLVGPGGDPLPFGLRRLDWALLGSCCGGAPAQVVQVTGWPGFVDTGDPAFGRTTVAEDCAQGGIVPIATLDIDWMYPPTSVFYMAAGALAPAVTCDDGEEILLGRSLEVTPTGVTPAATEPWGRLKARYR